MTNPIAALLGAIGLGVSLCAIYIGGKKLHSLATHTYVDGIGWCVGPLRGDGAKPDVQLPVPGLGAVLHVSEDTFVGAESVPRCPRNLVNAIHSGVLRVLRLRRCSDTGDEWR